MRKRRYFYKSAKGSRESILQIVRRMKPQPKFNPTSRDDKQWQAEVGKLARIKPRRQLIGYLRCAAGSGTGAFHLWAGAYAGAEND